MKKILTKDEIQQIVDQIPGSKDENGNIILNEADDIIFETNDIAEASDAHALDAGSHVDWAKKRFKESQRAKQQAYQEQKQSDSVLDTAEKSMEMLYDFYIEEISNVGEFMDGVDEVKGAIDAELEKYKERLEKIYDEKYPGWNIGERPKLPNAEVEAYKNGIDDISRRAEKLNDRIKNLKNRVAAEEKRRDEAQKTDRKAEEAKSKAEDAESKSEEAKSASEQASADAAEAKGAAESADAKADTAKEAADAADTKADEAKDAAATADAKADEAEEKVTSLESRVKTIEDSYINGVEDECGLVVNGKEIGVDENYEIPGKIECSNWRDTYLTVSENSAKWENGEANLVTGASTGLTVSDKTVVPADGCVIPTMTSTAEWHGTTETVRSNSAAWSAGEANLVTGAESGLTVVNKHVIPASGMVIPSLASYTKLQDQGDTVSTHSAEWGQAGEVYVTGASDGLEITDKVVGIDDNHVLMTTAQSASIADACGTLALKSGHWEGTYGTVSEKSADWGKGDENLVTGVDTDSHLTLNDKVVGVDGSYIIPTKALTAAFDGWYTTGQAKSGIWENASTIVSGNSAKWNGTYDTVNEHSADWGKGEDNLVTGATGGLTLSDKVVTVDDGHKLLTTAEYSNITTELGTIATKTGKWDGTYDTVHDNSGAWASGEANLVTGANGGLEIVDKVVGIDADHILLTKLQKSSYDEACGTVLLKSANWEGTYHTVEDNSAAWASGEANIVTGAGNGLVVDNMVVVPDTGREIPSSDSIEKWDNCDLVLTYYSGMWNAWYTIGMGEPGEGNEPYKNWESTYNLVTEKSANWDGSYTVVCGNSADWNSTKDAVDGGKDDWNSVHNTVITYSGNWNNGIVGADLPLYVTTDKHVAINSQYEIPTAPQKEGYDNIASKWFGFEGGMDTVVNDLVRRVSDLETLVNGLSQITVTIDGQQHVVLGKVIS